MNSNPHLHWNEDFDEPWRRLPWIVLAAMACWIALLGGFAKLLERRPAPEPPPPIEAQIVELPPPPTAGLQGGGRPAGPPAITHHPPAAPAKPKPVRIVRPKPPAVHHVHKARVKPAPPITEPPSPFGTVKNAEPPAAAPAVASKGPAGAAAEGRAIGGAGGGVPGAAGSGGGAGLGSDSSGARAMYAPKPTVPDDLRENAFSAIAVARFRVSADGDVKVDLVKPTPNPRLNQILIETLKQWRFFPAMKGGVAINSEFEVRIPIAVQ
jgi:periplasmic protein TonB